MKIPSLPLPWLPSAERGSSGAAATHTSPAAAEPAVPIAASELPQLPEISQLSPAALEVLGRYDLRNLSPRDFSEMLEQLRSKAALPGPLLDELARLRTQLDVARLDPDEPLDLIAFGESRIRELARGRIDGEHPDALSDQLSQSQRQLDLLRRIHVVREGSQIGFDAYA